MTSQHVLGVLVIAAFLAVPLIIGGLAARRSTATADDYFVQGRSMGSVAVFFTVTATWWSAFAFLGSNASFYLDGPLYWTALVWNVFFGVMFYWIGKRVWFHGKRGNYVTPRDFFVGLFGSQRLGTFIAIILLVFTLPHLQIQLTGGAYLMEVASDGAIPFWLGALLFYLVIIAYVWAGGVRAIAWTDVFYGVTIFLGLIAGGIFVVGEVGGMGTMFDRIEQVQPDHLVLGDGVWMTWVAMFLITPLGALMGPQMWTRMYATKSARIFDLMPFLVGLMAFAYIGSMLVGNSAVLLDPVIEEADQVLPAVLLEHAPLLLALLVIAAGAGAAMSTANSQVHAMAASYTVDFHERYVQRDLPERKRVWIGRWAILGFSALAYVMTLYVPGLLVTIGLVAFAGLAQVVVPTVGALFWRRASVVGATAGLVVGLVSLAVFTAVPAWAPGPFSEGGGGLLALLLNAAVFTAVSLCTKPRDERLLGLLRSRKHDFDREKWESEDTTDSGEPSGDPGLQGDHQ
ncbi:sodium:solute symporter family protein [Nocardiopsis sp. HNM0947]|uniref:Sodium:solute symporter family protein n=1 Tax=Nocardiopsis coralli TaxID=2772213 RepID=A0ABR9P3J9_9ACTN|nr:sodium:solute symporter family protein [Nocardiopsis coralli]MBE2998384.1 sodium:solute symporter family protein [Nocardiopsis coralli]